MVIAKKCGAFVQVWTQAALVALTSPVSKGHVTNGPTLMLFYHAPYVLEHASVRSSAVTWHVWFGVIDYEMHGGKLKTSGNFSLYLEISSINPYGLFWFMKSWNQEDVSQIFGTPCSCCTPLQLEIVYSFETPVSTYCTIFCYDPAYKIMNLHR